jgi:hypothetical protein
MTLGIVSQFGTTLGFQIYGHDLYITISHFPIIP